MFYSIWDAVKSAFFLCSLISKTECILQEVNFIPNELAMHSHAQSLHAIYNYITFPLMNSEQQHSPAGLA